MSILDHRFSKESAAVTNDFITNNDNFTNAIAFISVNQLHNTITNAACLITALITPKILPTKYIGMNILVAGSSTVNVNIALAEIKKVASAISQ